MHALHTHSALGMCTVPTPLTCTSMTMGCERDVGALAIQNAALCTAALLHCCIAHGQSHLTAPTSSVDSASGKSPPPQFPKNKYTGIGWMECLYAFRFHLTGEMDWRRMQGRSMDGQHNNNGSISSRGNQFPSVQADRPTAASLELYAPRAQDSPTFVPHLLTY